MWSYTPGLLQSYKSDLDDEIDEGFWLRYMLGTWLRQVVHEVCSWWCWYILMSHSWWVVDTWLVHGWMHLFMVQVVWHRLVHGWCTCLWYKLISIEDFFLISVGAEAVRWAFPYRYGYLVDLYSIQLFMKNPKDCSP